LRTGIGFTGFVLTSCGLAIRTFLHNSILAHHSGHSPRNTAVFKRQNSYW
jgi:hypothetical protein